MDHTDQRLKRYIVSCHVDKPLEEEPPKPVYEVPIQVGAVLTDVRTCEINDLRLWLARDNEETRRLPADYRKLTHFSNVVVRRICQESK